MFCKNCGNEIKNGSRYCGNCGCKVEDSDDIYKNNDNTVNDINIQDNKTELKKPNNKILKIISMLDYNGKVRKLKELKESGKMTETELKKAITKLWLKMFFGTIGFIVLITAIFMGILIGKIEIDKKIEKSKEVQVPNVIGKTISEAEQELSTINLNIRAENTNLTTLYSGDPDAIIIEQRDKEGTILKKGDTVRVEAKTKEQIDKEKQEEEERRKKQEEAKAKGYRSSPATRDTIIGCAKTLINNSLRSSSTARWDKCEKVDEDNYGRCLVYISLEAQNGFGAYSKLNYFVILQYVEYNGEFTYKPYSYSYELSTFGGQSVYDYYVTAYKNGNIYPSIQTFLNNNGWNTRPDGV